MVGGRKTLRSRLGVEPEWAPVLYPTLIHVTSGQLQTSFVPLCPCLENGLTASPPSGVARFNELMMFEHFELQMKVIVQNKARW